MGMPSVRAAIIWTDLLRLLADVGQDTAIDIEHVTIHCVRSVRSQEHSRTTQL